MKVRSRHSDKIQDVSFINWFYDTPNKEDYIVIEWGDLVYWQLIDKDGIKNDHRIIVKDHAQRIHDLDQKRNSIRDLTPLEWSELRRQFFDSPIPNSKIKEEKEIELRSIEKELLQYVSKSTDKVKSTKTFADAKGFSVSTINDVAKSLKEKYLITTEIEAGLDPQTQRSYTSFRCESTSLGDEYLISLERNIKDQEIKTAKNEPQIEKENSSPKNKRKLTLGEKLGICSLIVAILVLIFGNNLLERKIFWNSNNSPDIKGAWDERAAEEIIYQLMNEYGRENKYDVGCLEDECEIHHKIIEHFWVDMLDKKSFVTIAYTATVEEMGACHFCPAPLSIFEFVKSSEGYELTAKYFNRETLGKYGNPPEKINVIPIGYDKYGIEIIDDIDWSGGEGIITENYFLYCPIGDDFREVLNFEYKYYILEGYPNVDETKWESTIEFIKEGTGYYDIKVDMNGVIDKKSFEENLRFRFNGLKYIKI